MNYKKLAKNIEAEVNAKFGNQIVGVFTSDYKEYPGVSVALISDEYIGQEEINMVEDLAEEYNQIAEMQLDAWKEHDEGVFGTNATHWDELESEENPDGIALTVYVNLNQVPEENAGKLAEYFVKLVNNSLENITISKKDIKESTIINEGTFSEIDNAIQEYIMHVKKFDAPVTIYDCIDFCADVLDMDIDALWELENANGTISDGLSEYFNEGFRQTHRHLIKEAKKVLEKNGYIVK